MCLHLPSGRGGFIAGRTPFDPTACYSKAEEGLSTRCGGQHFIVFYGTAKPIRAPVIEARDQLEGKFGAISGRRTLGAIFTIAPIAFGDGSGRTENSSRDQLGVA